MHVADRYDFPPFLCVRCGSDRTPVIVFETAVELLLPAPPGLGNMPTRGEGVFQVCRSCLREAASLMGFADPEMLEIMRNVTEEANELLAAADAELDRLRSDFEAALQLLRMDSEELAAANADGDGAS